MVTKRWICGGGQMSGHGSVKNSKEEQISASTVTSPSERAKSDQSLSEEAFFKDKIVEKHEQPKADEAKNEAQWARIEKNFRTSAAAPEDIEDWAIVVDDSPTSLTVVAGILKSLNLGVHTFRNPVAALKFLKDANPKDVAKILMVFSDLEMPEMDGIDFMRELRKSPQTEKLPFILVSGSIERKYIARLSANRPDGIVIKPFSSKLIVDQVMKALVARQKHASHPT